MTEMVFRRVDVPLRAASPFWLEKVAMKRICLFIAPVFLAACGGDHQERYADGYASGPLPTTESVQRQLNSDSAVAAPMNDATGEVVVGRRLAADGTVPPTERTDHFVTGEEIHLAVKVPQPAPPRPAHLRVAWYGPNDNLIHEDAKQTSEGGGYVSFSTLDSADWDPGEYRTEVWLEDEKIAERRFAVAQR